MPQPFLFHIPVVTPLARVRIELPDRFSFSTPITIYINHIN